MKIRRLRIASYYYTAPGHHETSSATYHIFNSHVSATLLYGRQPWIYG